jgi:hypothetical protein
MVTGRHRTLAGFPRGQLVPALAGFFSVCTPWWITAHDQKHRAPGWPFPALVMVYKNDRRCGKEHQPKRHKTLTSHASS